MRGTPDSCLAATNFSDGAINIGLYVVVMLLKNRAEEEVMVDGNPYAIVYPANVKVLVPIVYGVPGLTMYCLVIVALLRRLSSPFYRFFAVVGITVRMMHGSMQRPPKRKLVKSLFFGFTKSDKRRAICALSCPDLMLLHWLGYVYTKIQGQG